MHLIRVPSTLTPDLAEPLTIAAWDFGGPVDRDATQRPPLLVVHATGFCTAVWGRIAEPLRADRRVVGYDQRGHGDSDKPAVDAAYEWERYADDCLAVLAALDLGPVDAVGHSSGAATLVLAASREPQRFRRLVLIEPIISPQVDNDELLAGNALADGARRRRMEFDSLEEMRDRFVSRPPMQDWDPATLDAYLLAGTDEIAGGRRRLKCPGEIEAQMYEGGPRHRGYDALVDVASPTLLLCGETASPLPVDYWRHLAERLPHGDFGVLDGLGHFAPMQDPDRVRTLVQDFLDGP